VLDSTQGVALVCPGDSSALDLVTVTTLVRLCAGDGAEFVIYDLSQPPSGKRQSWQVDSETTVIRRYCPYSRYWASVPRLIRTMATPSTNRTDPGLGQSDSDSEIASAIFHWAALGETNG
jgi:hypothetical protein